MTKKIHVYDFFSGCGGTSAGLKSVGMDIVFGLDIDFDSSNTFKKNNPLAHFVHGDIRQTSVDSIEHLFTQSQKVMLRRFFVAVHHASLSLSKIKREIKMTPGKIF